MALFLLGVCTGTILLLICEAIDATFENLWEARIKRNKRRYIMNLLTSLGMTYDRADYHASVIQGVTREEIEKEIRKGEKRK